MTDRYEKIRRALAEGPTPGAWYLDGEGIRALVRDANGVIVAARHRMPGHKNETNMRLIAACDPDTIRALLAERDQLAASLEAAREERDALAAEVERLAEALKKVAQSLEWYAHGRCRGFDDEAPLPTNEAVELAERTLAKVRA